MGSNSFRLEIGQLAGGRYRRIDYLKETVRLGAGLDAAGFLSEEAATRGLDCLARFARRLDGFAADTRCARSRRRRLREAQQPRCLPAARTDRPRPSDRDHLRARGSAPDLRRRRAAAAVDRAAPGHRHRRPLDRDDPRPRHAAAPGRVVPGRQRQPVDEVLRRRPLQRARVSRGADRRRRRARGSARAVRAAPLAARRSARRARSARSRRCSRPAASATAASRPAGLRWLMERCLEAGSADRLALPGLKNDRRAVIAGGLAILYTLATHFGIAELQAGARRAAPGRDLRPRARARRPSAAPAARTCATPRCASCSGASRSTSRRRARVGDARRSRCSTAPRRRRAARRGASSRWAAALHEAGMMISHHDHHRHSAYLLAHVDAAGFSQSQLRRIGELVLGQRGGLRKIEARAAEHGLRAAPALPAPGGDRLPCARRRRRRGDRAARRRRHADGRRSRAGWAEAHPRAVHLLRDEIDAWARTGVLAPRLVTA